MMRFAPGGRRLIVGVADGSYETWPIPSSPRDKLGHWRRWEPPKGHTVVAVGIGKRSVLAATVTRTEPSALQLSYGDNERIRVALPPDVAALLEHEVLHRGVIRVGACALVRFGESMARTDLVIEVLGRLCIVPNFVMWPRHGTVLTAQPVTLETVLQTAYFPKSFVWTERHDNGRIHILEMTASGSKQVQTVGARDDADVQFGFVLPARPGWGVVSVAWDQTSRRVAAAKLEPTTLTTAAPVVGVAMLDGVPALLIKPHPYRLAWQVGDAQSRKLLPTSPSPIVAVAVCPHAPNIAWLTEAGEVVVYSMQYEAVLFRRSGDTQ